MVYLTSFAIAIARRERERKRKSSGTEELVTQTEHQLNGTPNVAQLNTGSWLGEGSGGGEGGWYVNSKLAVEVRFGVGGKS